MIAALPMYLRAENRAAHAALWAGIRNGLRARGIAAPDALTEGLAHMDLWARPDLVLAQICNLPWRARFRDRVTLIGAADYGLPGCAPGQYYSVFLARADDPATDVRDLAHRFAYNEGLSNSGWGAPQLYAAARGFALVPLLATGAHQESARAVAEGRADLCAIDAVTWRNLTRWWPGAAALRVIGRSDASPGMSFATRAGQAPGPYREAIADAIADLDPGDAAILGLRGIVVLPEGEYDLPLPPTPKSLAR